MNSIKRNVSLVLLLTFSCTSLRLIAKDKITYSYQQEDEIDDFEDELDVLAQQAEEGGITRSIQDRPKPSAFEKTLGKFFLLAAIKYYDTRDYFLEKIRQFILYICPNDHEKNKKREA